MSIIISLNWNIKKNIYSFLRFTYYKRNFLFKVTQDDKCNNNFEKYKLVFIVGS